MTLSEGHFYIQLFRNGEWVNQKNAIELCFDKRRV